MIVAKAYAKINWALEILNTLENGYHEMDMLMQSISLHDTLTFEEAEEVVLLTDGEPDPFGEKNLIVRAARLLQKETGCTKGVKMELTKRIPARAGMGGGSSDCAAALIVLNSMWKLGIPKERLHELGFSLGADVAFCLAGGLQRARGMGERLDALEAGKSPEMIVMMPDEGLSTGPVFQEYDRMERKEKPVQMEKAQDALVRGEYAELNCYAKNVLTEPAMKQSAAIEQAIDEISELGATMVRMSGSGSSVFAVFPDAETADRAQEILAAKYPFSQRVQTMPTGVEVEWNA